MPFLGPTSPPSSTGLPSAEASTTPNRMMRQAEEEQKILGLLTDLAGQLTQSQTPAVDLSAATEPPPQREAGGLLSNFFPEGSSTIEKLALLQPFLPKVAVGSPEFTQSFIEQTQPNILKTLAVTEGVRGAREARQAEKGARKRQEQLRRQLAQSGAFQEMAPLLQLGVEMGVIAPEKAFEFHLKQTGKTEETLTKLGPEDVLVTGKGKEVARGLGKKLSPDEQVFASLQKQGLSVQEAYEKLTALKTRSQKFGVEREAVASELYNATFGDLDSAQQAAVNNRIKQDRIDVGAAQRAQSPVPVAIATRMAASDSAIKTANDIYQIFAPAFTGPLAGRAGSVREKLGLTSDQEAQFRQSVFVLAEQIIRSRTGAQASFAELQNALKGMPAVNLPSNVFLSRLKSVTRQMVSTRESLADALKATRSEGGAPSPVPLFDISVPQGSVSTGTSGAATGPGAPGGFGQGAAPDLPPLTDDASQAADRVRLKAMGMTDEEIDAAIGRR